MMDSLKRNNYNELKELLANRKVGFFFGAGVSVPCFIPPIPSGCSILNVMLCPYFNAKSTNLGTEEEIEVYRFIIYETSKIARKCLKCCFPNFRISEGSIHEDVFDIIAGNCTYKDKDHINIPCCVNYELTNILTGIKCKFPSYWCNLYENEKTKLCFNMAEPKMEETISRHVVCYMKKVLAKLLYTQESIQIKGYDLVRDFINTLKIKPSFYTLNNDLILETLLKQENISYFDGFSKEDDCGENKWERNFSPSDINIFKLHDSINEFQGAGYRFILREEDVFKNHLKEKIPTSIIGTGMKKGYYERKNKELMELFKKDLNDCDILFISGFSFNDVEIVKMLNDRISNKDKKLLIIRMYKKSAADFSNTKAYFKIGNCEFLKPMNEPYKLNGQVVDIGKFMENVCLDDIERVFGQKKVKDYLGV